MIVGVFDSGLGGLSVLEELAQERKGTFVYVGDSKRAPYGNRDVKEIISFSREMIAFLKSKGATVFVSACNSISAQDTDELLKDMKIERCDYYDMVTSTGEGLRSVVGKDDTVLIYGTVATIASGAYERACRDICNLETLASVNLARAIETSDPSLQETEISLLVEECIVLRPSHILLACTHYPLIEGKIRKALDDNGLEDIELINPAVFVGRSLYGRLVGPQDIAVYTTKITSEYSLYGSAYGDQEEILL